MTNSDLIPRVTNTFTNNWKLLSISSRQVCKKIISQALADPNIGKNLKGLHDPNGNQIKYFGLKSSDGMITVVYVLQKNRLSFITTQLHH